jgi:Ca-activated chloride channel homolog
MRPRRLLLLALLAAGLLLGTAPSVRADDARARIAALAPKYREWLDEVQLLIGKDERALFLALDKDYQRDAFIQRFWEARNPVPGAFPNAFKLQWESRLAALREEYGSLNEDRARMRLLHGEPGAVIKTDCGMALWPLEVWHYVVGERLPRDLYLVFYQRGAGGAYRLWRHADGLTVLMARLSNIDPIDLGISGGVGARIQGDQNLETFAIWMRDNCGGEWSAIYPAIAATDREDQGTLFDGLLAPPPPRDAEWLESFRAASAGAPATAAGGGAAASSASGAAADAVGGQTGAGAGSGRAAAGTGAATAAAKGAGKRDERRAVARLDPKYRTWLDEVALLIGDDERRQFLALDKDYQRDGFIHRFWEARNPVPGASRNAFKAQWESRVELARQQYGSLTEDRARMLLLHGEASVFRTDCGMALWPLEIWRYLAGERLPRDVVLIFYQRGAGGPYRLWRRSDGLAALTAHLSSQMIAEDDLPGFARYANRASCGEQVIRAVALAEREDRDGLFNLIFQPAPPRDTEWLASFRGLSTDLPAAAASLPATLEVQFPARERGRTVVQGVVQVPVAAAVPADLEGHRSYNFLLTGEVLHESELVESFRYRFDLPAATLAGDRLPLVFERALGSGDYLLVLRVEDLHSHHNFRDERQITVPPPQGLPEVSASREPPEVVAALAAARAELQAGGGGGDGGGEVGSASVHLVPPPGGQQTGGVRLEAETSGAGIRKLTFFLDGKEMLSRTRPPYSVELNLGPVPVTHEVRAAAVDAAGRELGSDTLVLNPPPQRFAVRLREPRPGGTYRGQVLARAEVHMPDGGSLDRLELFYDDQRVATLYQPPYAQLIPLAPAGPAGRRAGYVRAVAYLAGGATAEDLVVINSPDVVEKLDVRLVELYAAVFDRAGHPVARLGAADFEVKDGGEPQELLRCDRVKDLPLHLLFAIDTSASMAASLPQVQRAALGFLERVLTPRDRAALLTFSDSPVLRAPFTGNLELLAGALAGLNAERGTALYDSLVFGLSYMKGVQHGQAALLLFTDGGDHVSRLTFDEALEFARRSGVAIYAIGARIPRLDLQVRSHLARLAEETGGRSFFIDSAAELDGVYAAIADELRSRYLLAYQPKAPPRQGEFRQVEVRVAGPGLRVKTIRGYYP